METSTMERLFKQRKLGPDGHYVTVTAGLRKFDGQAPYFTVTGETVDSGGCIHDEILTVWPELAPVVALHLSDENGAPMHAVANALYWAGLSSFPDAKDVAVLARHLRVGLGDAETIIDYCAGDRNSTEAMEFCVKMERARWLAEADEARSILDGLGVDA